MANILVVDDETNIRNMIRLALQHVGYTVGTASDGPEGLQMYGDGSTWDVVLLDHRMPGMAGLDVLREMRRIRPSARVVMITAFGTIDLAVDAMKAGATDFLRKPFTTEVLRGAVRAALADRPGVHSADGQAGPPQVTYGMTLVNGFRIESKLGSLTHADGDCRLEVVVTNPDGESRRSEVHLPPYVVELVKAHANREAMPTGDRFWQSLCEEIVANYVWQHSDYPPDEPIEVEDLDTGLKRWMDAVLSATTS